MTSVNSPSFHIKLRCPVSRDDPTEVVHDLWVLSGLLTPRPQQLEKEISFDFPIDPTYLENFARYVLYTGGVREETWYPDDPVEWCVLAVALQPIFEVLAEDILINRMVFTYKDEEFLKYFDRMYEIMVAYPERFSHYVLTDFLMNAIAFRKLTPELAKVVLEHKQRDLILNHAFGEAVNTRVNDDQGLEYVIENKKKWPGLAKILSKFL